MRIPSFEESHPHRHCPVHKAGIVDEDIQTPEFRHGRRDHRFDFRCARDVDADSNSLPAFVLDRCSHPFRAFLVDVSDHNPSSLGGKTPHDRFPEARGSYGDYGNRLLESHGA